MISVSSVRLILVDTGLKSMHELLFGQLLLTNDLIRSFPDRGPHELASVQHWGACLQPGKTAPVVLWLNLSLSLYRSHLVGPSH